MTRALSSSGARAESERATFPLSTEFHGPRAYTDPAAALNVRNGMANMVAFWPPADEGMRRFLASHAVRLNFHLPAATQVARESAAAIESQRLAAARLCAAQPARGHLWSLMIEWDQSGWACFRTLMSGGGART